VQASGPQFVTVEDSMALVHRSAGRNPPASEHLRSEPAIVAGMAGATLERGGGVDWDALVADYDRIRDRIARVVPGFEDFNRRVRMPGGFSLPVAARERRFVTTSGKATFTVHPLPRFDLEPDEFLMMTIRSHDQFNTTVYSFDDRYRGIRGDRRVVLMHADDIEAAGLASGQKVDVTSRCGGEVRAVHGFRVVPYEMPRRTVATYFPEGNPLVALDMLAEKSRTPAYKSVPVRIRPAAEP
jgi:anaerobic selenocysteine-containing dehydrogenase